MAEHTDSAHLSIGEVLGLLLEEFPDITISKIRFLESQGLIDPERTPAGYRKFYETDVELLRVILREQKRNFLPLRVIKDRIDSGVIDPSGEIPPPASLRAVDSRSSDPNGDDPAEVIDPTGEHGHQYSQPSPNRHPAATGLSGMESGALCDRNELCSMARLTHVQLQQLEDFGLVAGDDHSGERLYDECAIQVARACAGLLSAGLEVRHLKGWRLAADREASMIEQIVAPMARRRDPATASQVRQEVERLEDLGARLRTALLHSALSDNLWR